jgi:hypothetical protein
MNDKREEGESWKNLLRFASYAKIRAWALRPGLPDPTYDSGRGWALDEFAMRFEPALLQWYKKVMANLHSPPNSRNKNHGYRWIEVSSELSDKLKAYLLDPRIRVEGFRFGAYGPTVIPRPLLEEMQPIVETSELVERGVRETYRKFEHVRVFQQERRKGRAGRPLTYDWPSLRDKLERERPHIPTYVALVEWCWAHVKPLPGKSASKDGSSDKTIRAAISKYRLEKFVTPQE